MIYPELIKECKAAIEKGFCLGCQALENPNFKGTVSCKYNKLPPAADSIKQIKFNLGGKK